MIGLITFLIANPILNPGNDIIKISDNRYTFGDIGDSMGHRLYFSGIQNTDKINRTDQSVKDAYLDESIKVTYNNIDVCAAEYQTSKGMNGPLSPVAADLSDWNKPILKWAGGVTVLLNREPGSRGAGKYSFHYDEVTSPNLTKLNGILWQVGDFAWGDDLMADPPAIYNIPDGFTIYEDGEEITSKVYDMGTGNGTDGEIVTDLLDDQGSPTGLLTVKNKNWCRKNNKIQWRWTDTSSAEPADHGMGIIEEGTVISDYPDIYGPDAENGFSLYFNGIEITSYVEEVENDKCYLKGSTGQVIFTTRKNWCDKDGNEYSPADQDAYLNYGKSDGFTIKDVDGNDICAKEMRQYLTRRNEYHYPLTPVVKDLTDWENIIVPKNNVYIDPTNGCVKFSADEEEDDYIEANKVAAYKAAVAVGGNNSFWAVNDGASLSGWFDLCKENPYEYYYDEYEMDLVVKPMRTITYSHSEWEDNFVKEQKTYLRYGYDDPCTAESGEWITEWISKGFSLEDVDFYSIRSGDFRGITIHPVYDVDEDLEKEYFRNDCMASFKQEFDLTEAINLKKVFMPNSSGVKITMTVFDENNNYISSSVSDNDNYTSFYFNDEPFLRQGKYYIGFSVDTERIERLPGMNYPGGSCEVSGQRWADVVSDTESEDGEYMPFVNQSLFSITDDWETGYNDIFFKVDGYRTSSRRLTASKTFGEVFSVTNIGNCAGVEVNITEYAGNGFFRAILVELPDIKFKNFPYLSNDKVYAIVFQSLDYSMSVNDDHDMAFIKFAYNGSESGSGYLQDPGGNWQGIDGRLQMTVNSVPGLQKSDIPKGPISVTYHCKPVHRVIVKDFDVSANGTVDKDDLPGLAVQAQNNALIDPVNAMIFVNKSIVVLPSATCEQTLLEVAAEPKLAAVNPTDGTCLAAFAGKIKKISADGTTILAELSGFNFPEAVSVNPNDGTYWVADTLNNKIKKINAECTRIIAKSVPNEFNNPSSVSVNPNDGTCWVADTGYNSVKKIKSDGETVFILSELRLDESGQMIFNNPSSVSVNPNDGTCWVADNNTVKKISADGATILAELSGFNSPEAISVNSNDGTCWVADTLNNKVKKINAECTGIIVELELDESGQMIFNNPSSVSVNPNDGTCWVADNNTVKKISADGSLILLEIDGLSLLQSVSVNPNDGSCWVAVADAGNNRIIKIHDIVDLYTPISKTGLMLFDYNYKKYSGGVIAKDLGDDRPEWTDESSDSDYSKIYIDPGNGRFRFHDDNLPEGRLSVSYNFNADPLDFRFFVSGELAIDPGNGRMLFHTADTPLNSSEETIQGLYYYQKYDGDKPLPPVVLNAPSVTSDSPFILKGSKQEDSSVWLEMNGNKTEIVEQNSGTTWTYPVYFRSGGNVLNFSSKRYELESDVKSYTISYNVKNPTIDNESPVSSSIVTLVGKKGKGTSIELVTPVGDPPIDDIRMIVSHNDSMTWNYTYPESLTGGNNLFIIRSTDRMGNQSDAVNKTIVHSTDLLGTDQIDYEYIDADSQGIANDVEIRWPSGPAVDFILTATEIEMNTDPTNTDEENYTENIYTNYNIADSPFLTFHIKKSSGSGPENEWTHKHITSRQLTSLVPFVDEFSSDDSLLRQGTYTIDFPGAASTWSISDGKLLSDSSSVNKLIVPQKFPTWQDYQFIVYIKKVIGPYLNCSLLYKVTDIDNYYEYKLDGENNKTEHFNVIGNSGMAIPETERIGIVWPQFDDFVPVRIEIRHNKSSGNTSVSAFIGDELVNYFVHNLPVYGGVGIKADHTEIAVDKLEIKPLK